MPCRSGSVRTQGRDWCFLVMHLNQMPNERPTFDRKEWHEKFLTMAPRGEQEFLKGVTRFLIYRYGNIETNQSDGLKNCSTHDCLIIKRSMVTTIITKQSFPLFFCANGNKLCSQPKRNKINLFNQPKPNIVHAKKNYKKKLKKTGTLWLIIKVEGVKGVKTTPQSSRSHKSRHVKTFNLVPKKIWQNWTTIHIQRNLGLTNLKGPKILFFGRGFVVVGVFYYKINYRGTWN